MSKPLDEKSAAAAFIGAHGVAELVEAVFRETFEHGAHIHVFVGAEIACLNPDAQVRSVYAFEKATVWRRKEREEKRSAALRARFFETFRDNF